MLQRTFLAALSWSILWIIAGVAHAQLQEATTTTTPPSSSALEPAAEPMPAQPVAQPVLVPAAGQVAPGANEPLIDYTSLLYVFMLATFIGLGVILRVSRLLHTPLMSLTNAISAIAVVGSIIVTGDPHHPLGIRILGAVALFASMTNIVSGFLITDRMLKMFKSPGQGGQR
jgi:proton-translocating NAD(P)+ transhydrogenase subunit alpha